MSATSYSSGRQGSPYKSVLSSHPSGSQSQSLSLSRSAPSPLHVFPTKGDVIKRTFVAASALKNKQLPKLNEAGGGYTGLFGQQQSNEDAAEQQWLFPDKLQDPSFGVKGKSSKDELARSYRRLASSSMFVNPSDSDVPLSTLSEKKSGHSTFVLVEESRLQELIKLDEALQRERALLGRQCTQSCADFQISARVPIPATRFAIHSLCEQQMRKSRTEIMKLQSEWSLFSRQNHYHKPHLFIKDSYIKNAPPAQKAMKLRLVKEATDTWLLRKERDTMSYEDNMSLLACAYYDALQRQKDYERYFILASRYGPFSEVEFHADARPGKRYYVKVTKGAVKLQLLWDRFWAMAKLRRYRATRLIQKYVRRHIVYKKLHPIIKLRLKIGKKTYYIFCFARWKEYNYLVRLIKEAFAYHLSNCKDLCFIAWKKHVAELRNHRTKLLNKLAHRTKYAPVYRVMAGWKQFIQEIKDLKRRLRRLFGFPHFDIWMNYVKFSKKVKVLNKLATTINALGRGFIVRRRFSRKRKAQLVLWNFSLMIFARHKVEAHRKRLIDQEFEDWRPDEFMRRTARLNEIERQRMQRRQLYIQEKERAALKELQNHFMSGDGQQQLQIDSNNLLSLEGKQSKGLLGWSAEKRQEAINKAAKILKQDCLNFTRKLEGFTYDAKYPCFIKCIFHKCGSTFTTVEQYQNHIALSDAHASEDEFLRTRQDKYISFHLMLRHPKGLDSFRTFFVQKCGLSSIVNYIDAWVAVQDIKKSPANSQPFYKKAIAMYDLFLSVDGPRKCTVNYEGKEFIVPQLQTFKEMHNISFPGFFVKVDLPQTMFGLNKKKITKWSSEKILDPEFIQNFEYQCFIILFQAYISDPEFESSVYCEKYRSAVEKETTDKRNQLYSDFKVFRLNVIKDWTRDFKFHESQMSKKAFEAVDIVLSSEIERIFGLMEKVEVRNRLVELRNVEQSKHEYMDLFIDDVVAWSEENVLNFIFDFYSKALLKAMWDVPDYRKGMLQYSGLLKTHMTKKMKVEIAASGGKNDDKQWLDNFFLGASAVERKTLGSGKDMAAALIQKRVRGMLARSRTRNIFKHVYKKYVDKQSHRVYYYNVRTKESSWDPPKLYSRLFGKAAW